MPPPGFGFDARVAASRTDPMKLALVGGSRVRAMVGAVLALAAGAIARGASTDASAGWRALPLIKDGKVAPGWTQIGWGGFEVDDGALRTAPDARGLGLLVYRPERLGNCQVRVVFKASSAKANAGVYVRLSDGIFEQIGRPGAAFDRSTGKISKPSMEQMKLSAEREEGSWFAVHHGYEVQIADSGDAFHRTGAIYSLARSSAEPRPREWRTMIITLEGERILVDLDGKRVTEFDPASPAVPARKTWTEPKREPRRPVIGYLGLQNHDPGDLVWFKEVSVRPLPAAR